MYKNRKARNPNYKYIIDYKADSDKPIKNYLLYSTNQIKKANFAMRIKANFLKYFKKNNQNAYVTKDIRTVKEIGFTPMVRINGKLCIKKELCDIPLTQWKEAMEKEDYIYYEDKGFIKIFKKTINISATEKKLIKKLLSEEPTEDTCMGEDETITYTAVFPNNIEIDVKICGVQYAEDGSNLPWTEAVLFDNGGEEMCTEPSDDIFGTWNFSYDGSEYEVNVV